MSKDIRIYRKDSDNASTDFPYQHDYYSLIANDPDDYKIENAQDHPLIKILDFILIKLINKISNSMCGFITWLELKIVAKRRKKGKKHLS